MSARNLHVLFYPLTLTTAFIHTVNDIGQHDLRGLATKFQMPSQKTVPPFPSNLPTAEIHTVDFAALVTGSKEESRKVYEAATGYGFFYLSNHDVDYNFSMTTVSCRPSLNIFNMRPHSSKADHIS
jgi:hypothetical protein